MLWTLSPPPEPRPSLPDLLVGMQPGELDGHEDIQGAAFSCLLRLAFPKTMLSKIYMVEVGVHQAALAVRLLREHPQLQYLGIDPYRGYYEGRKSEEGPKRYGAPEHYRSSLRRLRQFGQRAHLCRSTSMQASKGPLHSCRSRWAAANLDAVFIDGEHDFASVDQDLRLWAPRVRPGGLVAGHDYRLPHALDLVEAVHRHLPPGRQLQVGAREIQADPKDPAAKKKQQAGPEIPKDTKASTARRKQSTGGFARPAEPRPQDLEPAGQTEPSDVHELAERLLDSDSAWRAERELNKLAPDQLQKICLSLRRRATQAFSISDVRASLLNEAEKGLQEEATRRHLQNLEDQRNEARASYQDAVEATRRMRIDLELRRSGTLSSRSTTYGNSRPSSASRARSMSRPRTPSTGAPSRATSRPGTASRSRPPSRPPTANSVHRQHPHA